MVEAGSPGPVAMTTHASQRVERHTRCWLAVLLGTLALTPEAWARPELGGHVVLKVGPDVEVRLDGRVLSGAERDVLLELPPGARRLSFSRPGRAATTLDLEVKLNRTHVVRLSERGGELEARTVEKRGLLTAPRRAKGGILGPRLSELVRAGNKKLDQELTWELPAGVVVSGSRAVKLVATNYVADSAERKVERPTVKESERARALSRTRSAYELAAAQGGGGSGPDDWQLAAAGGIAAISLGAGLVWWQSQLEGSEQALDLGALAGVHVSVIRDAANVSIRGRW